MKTLILIGLFCLTASCDKEESNALPNPSENEEDLKKKAACLEKQKKAVEHHFQERPYSLKELTEIIVDNKINITACDG